MWGEFVEELADITRVIEVRNWRAKNPSDPNEPPERGEDGRYMDEGIAELDEMSEADLAAKLEAET